MAQLTPDVNMA